MTKALNIDGYHGAIVEGLVISVGGLTESVVKNSSAALLDWARTMKKLKGASHLARLGTTLLSLMGKWEKDERVILPLLKTLHVLLSNDILFGDEVQQDNHDAVAVEEIGPEGPVEPEDTFFHFLLAKLKKEASNSKSYAKSIAVAQVLIDLVNGELENKGLFKEIMVFLLTLLGHPFPKVRRFVAENLYLSFWTAPRLGRSAFGKLGPTRTRKWTS